MKDLKFDTRMTEKSLRSGQMNAEELKKHLNSLEDCSANILPLKIDEKNIASPAVNSGYSTLN